MEWQPIETAPMWEEVIVFYKGKACRKSQPKCIATAVLTDRGWSLGSFPGYREVMAWQHFPEPPSKQ